VHAWFLVPVPPLSQGKVALKLRNASLAATQCGRKEMRVVQGETAVPAGAEVVEQGEADQRLDVDAIRARVLSASTGN
jgi:hypothetical protein